MRDVHPPQGQERQGVGERGGDVDADEQQEQAGDRESAVDVQALHVSGDLPARAIEADAERQEPQTAAGDGTPDPGVRRSPGSRARQAPGSPRRGGSRAQRDSGPGSGCPDWPALLPASEVVLLVRLARWYALGLRIPILARRARTPRLKLKRGEAGWSGSLGVSRRGLGIRRRPAPGPRSCAHRARPPPPGHWPSSGPALPHPGRWRRRCPSR